MEAPVFNANRVYPYQTNEDEYYIVRLSVRGQLAKMAIALKLMDIFG